ncbi:hypothetical protein JCM6882_006243 [Rhodosporidiobolus microsporus]
MLVRSSLVALAAATLVAAQSSSGGSATSSAIAAVTTAALPSCALQCTLSALAGTPCESYGVNNITCICTSSEFQLAYYTCQTQSCNSTDLNAAEQYGDQICEQNGTPIDIDETPSGYTGAPSTATATETGDQSRSATRSASASASVSSVLSSVSESLSSAASAAASSAGSGSGGGNGAMGGVRVEWAAGVGAAVVAGGLAVVAGAW